jgi:hypothetical protein
MSPSLTMTTSHSKADVIGNLYIADFSQKLPAASDNVQNHTQVTEVVGLVSVPIRDNLISRADNWYCRCRTHIPQQVGVEDNSIPTPPHADKSLINRT